VFGIEEDSHFSCRLLHVTLGWRRPV